MHQSTFSSFILLNRTGNYFVGAQKCHHNAILLSRLNASVGKTEDDKSVFGKDAVEELVKTTFIFVFSLWD